MIGRIHQPPKASLPTFDANKFLTESDVEQKLVYPFLANATYLNLPPLWIRTKHYMSPTEIDKVAGKRFGYFPDYSIWINGLPLVVVEVKATDVAIESALREARLYSIEINKRYPPNVNPIRFIFACNGVQFGLSEWDSETTVFIANCEEARPGSAIFNVIHGAIGKRALEDAIKALLPHFQTQNFFSVSAFMGGQSRLNQQLGVNEFAEPLFPTLTKYFGSTSDEVPDDVIDRAYVTSDELGRYEGVLETYLKDRTNHFGGSQLKSIETTKTHATGISTEVQKFASNPSFYSRVQLIIGAVGAGKSTFVRRYYRRLMSAEVRERTLWSFINFNILAPHDNLQEWIARHFITSFSEVNGFDLYEHNQIEKIFSHELKQFEKGPNARLKEVDKLEFERRRATLMENLVENHTEFARCISRHFSGERCFGIVIVFDNVDKRSRDLQLNIFEAAQWFKAVTRALVLINLRDSTYEAHKNEPPLDAFSNAINFYVQPPRFAQVIKKRLELVLEVLPGEVAKRQEYALLSGYRIKYPASRLGEFLMTIYLSLFDQRSVKVASALEALVAKDVRTALGMFADILVSPHIPTSEITGAILSGGTNHIQEFRIIRSLMRQRYNVYNGKSSYIRNVLHVDTDHNRPSHFLYADILEYLIVNRKNRIDVAREGYATVETIVKKMGSGGYDEEDVYSALKTLTEWGLIEPDSLIIENLRQDDAVRMHATGFIHMRFFIDRLEYLVGITTDMKFTSRDVAEDIGRIWAGQFDLPDLTRPAKSKILERLKTDLSYEYQRRCRRHAFYDEVGLGSRIVLAGIDRAYSHLKGDR